MVKAVSGLTPLSKKSFMQAMTSWRLASTGVSFLVGAGKVAQAVKNKANKTKTSFFMVSG